MATLKDIVHQLKEEVTGGRSTDDSVISEEFLADVANNARTKLIRQNESKLKPAKDLIQHFCIPMSMEDASLCCSWEAGCKVLRSTNKLPATLLTGEHSTGLFYVTSLDGLTGTKYHIVGPGEASIKPKYNQRIAFEQAGYLFVGPVNMTATTITKLLVFVIPENPIDWYEMEECEGGCGDPWDREFIPTHYVSDLKRIIWADVFAQMKQIRKDNHNNADDGTS
jgi:hypothetical protein